jgi:hypothetical protein
MEDPELTEDVRAVDAEVEGITPEVIRGRRGPPKGKGGRPKGHPNKTTVQMREMAQRLVSDPAYWRKLRTDFRKRKVHPQVETTILAYAYGKPVDRIEVGRAGDFSKLSDDELVAQLDAALAELRPQGVSRLVRRA